MSSFCSLSPSAFGVVGGVGCDGEDFGSHFMLHVHNTQRKRGIGSIHTVHSNLRWLVAIFL